MTEQNNQLVLEKAELELNNSRTQLVLGMLCVLGSCLSNHSIHLFDFIISLSLCLVLALISLEITGRFGNRLGASAACWAGLLFSAYPLHYEIASTVVDYDDMLVTLLKAIAVFALLRFFLLRETRYAIVTTLTAITVLVLGFFTGGATHLRNLSATETFPFLVIRNLQDFLFPIPSNPHSGLLKLLLISIYILLLSLLLFRLTLRTINLRTSLILCASALIVSSSPSLFPLVLCLGLTVMAMPVIDHAKFNFAEITSYIGIACLSALFLTWCQLNRLEHKNLPPNAVDLSKVQSSVRN